MNKHLDREDQRLVLLRAARYDQDPGPRVGDFIDYRDGVTRRIAHVWPSDENDDGSALIQTTDGGSFYLGGGFISYSGSLYPGLKASHLRRVWGSREGSVWVFHHDQRRAHNGVNASSMFRVYLADVDGTDPWRDDEK